MSVWKWILSWFRTRKTEQKQEIDSDDDLVIGALNLTIATGKTVMANRDKNGVVTFEVIE